MSALTQRISKLAGSCKYHEGQTAYEKMMRVKGATTNADNEALIEAALDEYGEGAVVITECGMTRYMFFPCYKSGKNKGKEMGWFSISRWNASQVRSGWVVDIDFGYESKRSKLNFIAKYYPKTKVVKV